MLVFMNFGKKLRELRKERNLKQSDVAEAVGVDKVHVSNWEIGKTKPSLDSVAGVSKLFNVSIDYLIFDNVPREGVEAINDIDLYEYFRKAEVLPEDKKHTVKDLIDALVFREKVKGIPETDTTEKQPPSLRKVAGKR
jgi:transcriptional regulator with XRE-family HTH domain